MEKKDLSQLNYLKISGEIQHKKTIRYYRIFYKCSERDASYPAEFEVQGQMSLDSLQLFSQDEDGRNRETSEKINPHSTNTSHMTGSPPCGAQGGRKTDNFS